MPYVLITSDEWNHLVGMVTRIDRNVTALSAKMETKMSDMDDAIALMTKQVQENTDRNASAVQALHHLADLVQENATQPAVLRDLAAKLKAAADPLAQAIMDTSGSPADPNAPQINPLQR